MEVRCEKCDVEVRIERPMVCCSICSENDGGGNAFLYFERTKKRTRERTTERKNRLAEGRALCGGKAKTRRKGAGGVDVRH